MADRLSRGNIAYICARNRHNAFDLIHRAFDDSGMTKRELAKRAGMREEVVGRILARPTNMTLNTLGTLIYALTGASTTFNLGPKPRRAAIRKALFSHAPVDDPQ